jgi:hypothetical protein
LNDIVLTPLIPWTRIRGKLVSGEMLVSGDQWPLVVYANLEYDPDDPWSGLFRNQILVWVGVPVVGCAPANFDL